MARPVAYGLLVAVVLTGCATLPPGSDLPKDPSLSLAHPEATDLGRRFAAAAYEHPGESAFRIISSGTDGFAARMQMVDAAEKTLDLQYFIFRGDETGRLLASALLRAAQRGVRVRLLVDDGPRLPGDEEILLLRAVPNVEIRIFNPLAYRGHSSLRRSIEFLFNSRRLDYRMHNKLLVADNAAALIGGRNIGDPYFQIDPEWQYADDDIFIAGPMVKTLSRIFDEFWNSALAIPAEALSGGMPSAASVSRYRERLAAEWWHAQASDALFVKRAKSGDPLEGIVDGRLPLVWATGQVVSDSPDKKAVKDGDMVGRLMYLPLANVADTAQSELLVITPYFVPTGGELDLLARLCQRSVRVQILTNSLESSDELLAHSGYMKYRKQLVQEGVELHELRMLPDSAGRSGGTDAMTRYGSHGLHAKLYVIDRHKLFIGSMNFDRRSAHLNTEVGVIIDSAALAQDAATRFDGLTRPGNAYTVQLAAGGGGASHLVWRTVEAGKPVTMSSEPARNWWQRASVRVLCLLPLDSEL